MKKKARIAMIAKKIFYAIEHDLRDRRGIRHEWDMVDEHIQKEIRNANRAIIRKILKELI